ncbi:MAG: hypothetical protein JWN15_1936 [Firmicutes bacterium]|nr:hypothetical protein [Bacillota bacterium]
MSNAPVEAAVIQVLVGIVIAVASSWVTVRMSLKRFRSEKWWERKATAYERVIEALYQAKAFFDAHLDAAMDGRELTEEFKAELQQRSKDAHVEINKATAIGAFMLSDQAQARLNKYQQEVAEAEKKEFWMYS